MVAADIPIPVLFCFHKNLCNLRYILYMPFKNIVFYGVLGFLAAINFILVLFLDIAFYVVLGSRWEPGTLKKHNKGNFI